MKQYSNSILFLIGLFALSLTVSCRHSVKTIGYNGEKKELKVSAAEAKQLIAKAKENQQKEVAKLDSINIIKEQKIDEQKIDTSMGHQIDIRIARYKKRLDSVSREIDTVERVMAQNPRFRKAFKQVKLKLLFISEFNKGAASRLTTLEMLSDGLDLSQQKMFELAAFFTPTSLYKVPDDKIGLVKDMFKPLVDSLIWFSNKYSQIPRTASIIVLGYADGEGFNREGVTGKALLADIGNPNATKEEMNQRLSQWRANGLGQIFEDMTTARTSELQNPNQLTIKMSKQGRGEEYPNPKIKDYQVSDPRRRIVLCFWSVLPD